MGSVGLLRLGRDEYIRLGPELKKRLRQWLESHDLPFEDVFEVRVQGQTLEADVYERNESGHRYAVWADTGEPVKPGEVRGIDDRTVEAARRTVRKRALSTLPGAIRRAL